MSGGPVVSAVVGRGRWRWRTPTWSLAMCWWFLRLETVTSDVCWRRESTPPNKYRWHSTELSSTLASTANIQASLTPSSLPVQSVVHCMLTRHVWQYQNVTDGQTSGNSIGCAVHGITWLKTSSWVPSFLLTKKPRTFPDPHEKCSRTCLEPANV